MHYRFLWGCFCCVLAAIVLSLPVRPVVAAESKTPVIVPDGLIAWYPLDGSGLDAVNQYHGVVFGATPTANRFGHPDTAMAFNGIDQYIMTPKPPPLQRTGATITLWARFEAGGKNVEWEDVFDGKGFSHPMISQDDGNGIRVFSLMLWKGMVRSNGQGSGWSLIPEDQATVDMGKWYHIAMVRDGIKHRLYVNGTPIQVKPEKDEVDVFNVCDCQPFLIGATGAWRKQTPRFHGALDDIRVYARALSADEIRQLYDERDTMPNAGAAVR